MLRRTLLALGCLICLAAAPSPKASALDPATGKAEGEIVWYDVISIGVEGRGWAETNSPFARLPAKAEKLVPKSVWGL